MQARYTHGEEIDQPLSMTRGGESYFYGVDHLGSVRLVTDAAGAVANRYDYDAFGNWEATSYETVANPFGFTARERDAESGLMFYRARYYDPEVGRFISEDPIGFLATDANLYRYVSNSVTNYRDPTGLILAAGAAEACLGGALGFAGGTVAGQAIGQLYGFIIAALDSVKFRTHDPDVGTGTWLNSQVLVYGGAVAAGCAAGIGANTAIKRFAGVLSKGAIKKLLKLGVLDKAMIAGLGAGLLWGLSMWDRGLFEGAGSS